jgi:hypothetical protein
LGLKSQQEFIQVVSVQQDDRLARIGLDFFRGALAKSELLQVTRNVGASQAKDVHRTENLGGFRIFEAQLFQSAQKPVLKDWRPAHAPLPLNDSNWWLLGADPFGRARIFGSQFAWPVLFGAKSEATPSKVLKGWVAEDFLKFVLGDQDRLHALETIKMRKMKPNVAIFCCFTKKF